MAESKVEPEESAKAAGEKHADVTPKKGILEGKNKKWIYGGMALVLVVLLYFLRKSSSSSSTTGTGAATAASSDIDPETGAVYGSPADVAALGGSGSQAATPGPQGATGATGATGPAGPAGASGSGNGLVKLTFAQAQKLAGPKGSGSLYYTSGSATNIVQGKYANDKNVTYYTTPQAAVKIGAL